MRSSENFSCMTANELKDRSGLTFAQIATLTGCKLVSVQRWMAKEGEWKRSMPQYAINLLMAYMYLKETYGINLLDIIISKGLSSRHGQCK